MSMKMGIELEYIICKEDDTDITEAELDQFYDEFIELVEKHNWYCGGGMGLKDVKEEKDKED